MGVETPADLEKFLSFTANQREAALIVVAQENALPGARACLENAGFIEQPDALAVLAGTAVPLRQYLVLNANNIKDAYDVAAQYPTGQVNIFDANRHRSVVIAPLYANATVVFLITAEELQVAKRQGLDILSRTGLTFRL